MDNKVTELIVRERLVDQTWFCGLYLNLPNQHFPQQFMVLCEASIVFFDSFTKTLMICSTLIPLAMAAVSDNDVI